MRKIDAIGSFALAYILISCLLLASAARARTCSESSDVGEPFSAAMQLLVAKRWQPAVASFEAILQGSSSPAAALYAAYSYAKLSDFDSARPLLEQAKAGRDCLTKVELEQLTWLIDQYNTATTIPKIYGRAGGTLSIETRYSFDPREIDRQYASALANCERQHALDSISPGRTRSSKKDCIEQARADHQALREEYRDPCGVYYMRPGDQEAVMTCVRRYQAREFGSYERLESQMPGLQ